MKWRQLKKLIQATFADSVRGRVEVWNTRYRKAHDDAAEAWMTIDRERVASFGEYTYFVESYREEQRLEEQDRCTDCRDPEQAENYYQAVEDAERTVKDRGIFPPWEFNGSLFDYLSMSIDDILSSDNPIVRAFGMLDRRFGKRRLREYDVSGEDPLVRTLYHFRCEAERRIE